MHAENRPEDWYPTLSLAERDWRWTRVRDFMTNRALDCLLIAGLASKDQLQQYVTNDHSDGYVIFPSKGEPVMLVWTASRVTSHLDAASKGEIPWVTDSRVGSNAATVVKVILEKGHDRATIGVVGLGGLGARQTEGWIPYRAWATVLEELPGAKFIDVTEGFSEVTFVKSEESLKVIRRAAEVGDLAGEALLHVTRAGVRESDIAAAVMQVLYREAAAGERAYIILHSGPHNPSWGPPLWLVRPQRPRVIEEGDIVQAEIFPSFGRLEVQLQMSIAVRPVSSINEQCARVARQSYEEGLKALRPGIAFAEVVDAMARPLAAAGAWNLTPLIHSLSPMLAIGGRGVGLEQLPGIDGYKGMHSLSITRPTRGDMLVEPNTLYELEPNVCLGSHRVNIGGTVIVTGEGIEELNKISARMHVV
ncbi:MAG: M24 family metallopeptidase [Chloroflexi bacterium]|nr:M24 family metallopeptidase [Chloroflexota bacterium]